MSFERIKFKTLDLYQRVLFNFKFVRAINYVRGVQDAYEKGIEVGREWEKNNGVR